MIPRIIHYFWVSDEKMPELIENCIRSWKEKMPDYEIIRWDTDSFDVNTCAYTREAFFAGKYAFVSDYVRLHALYTMGGIYLDTDVETIKSFDSLLDNRAFASFENEHSVASCVLGGEKGNPLFKEFLEYYNGRHFILDNGECDLTPNPVFITAICQKHGLKPGGSSQILDNITVYPADYFCPYNRASEELTVTGNTYCIHYFNGAWIPDDKKNIIQKRKEVIRRYGRLAGYIYYGFSILRTLGFRQFWKEFRFFAISK